MSSTASRKVLCAIVSLLIFLRSLLGHAEPPSAALPAHCRQPRHRAVCPRGRANRAPRGSASRKLIFLDEDLFAPKACERAAHPTATKGLRAVRSLCGYFFLCQDE